MIDIDRKIIRKLAFWDKLRACTVKARYGSFLGAYNLDTA